MFDPHTVAFEIKNPFKENGNIFITIWHKDPCKDGTDDSCGWFIRPRHCNKDIYEKIKNEFDFNFKHNYWFDKDGKQIFSTIGTLIQMYSQATWIYFNRNKRKQRRFMKKYLFEIIEFAENPIDCGGDNITNKWKCENDEERFNGMVGMIYSDICRKERKWWQHPKWHIDHWKIQFNFLQRFKRNKRQKNNLIGYHTNKITCHHTGHHWDIE